MSEITVTSNCRPSRGQLLCRGQSQQRLILDHDLSIKARLDHCHSDLLRGLQREIAVSRIASSVPSNADDQIMQVYRRCPPKFATAKELWPRGHPDNAAQLGGPRLHHATRPKFRS